MVVFPHYNIKKMKKVILITGISTGLGKETSKLLAKAGHTVYGTVRKDIDYKGPVNVLRMDLTDPVSIKDAVATIMKNEGRIDTLINNAGMHIGGPIETTPIENIRLQMETNFIGAVNLTQQVLPVMRKNNGGTIINFSSIGGLLGLPYQGIYSAVKFAIEGFSEALRMEVRQFNINVVLINPSDFRTNCTANRRKFLAPTGPDDPYNRQYEKTLASIEKDETNGGDPVVLARKLVKIAGYKNPRPRYFIATLLSKLAVILKQVLPGKLFSRLLGYFYNIK
jgi:NAD(P)-dependent dehydrogenase (short-subunit alcohol dehydrogenase family)